MPETKSGNSVLQGRQWRPWAFAGVVLAAYWVMAFNTLRVDWATNAQYYYGWFVPLLALGLFRLRWVCRPPAAPQTETLWVSLIALVALVLIFPVRLIEEANPEWRLIQWGHAVQMLMVTSCLLFYLGGWPWLKHFSFPSAFLLVAVPWPVPMEQQFVQGLMRFIAGLTVELAGLFDIPALQHGNLIQINSGLVGIDEACSGVRSLQTALFICLFLGELYRFGSLRRFLLIVLGFGVALAANLGRTFYLVWSAFHHGMERLHAVHDTAGQFVLVVTLIGIWILSQVMRLAKVPVPTPKAARQSSPRALPTRVVQYALVWLLLVEFSTEAWYRLHETKALPSARWTLSWPTAGAASEMVKIDDTVTAMLRYSEGTEAKWQDPAGNHWQGFFFRWAPGRNSAQLASAHTPDICLRGVGCRLTSDLGAQNVPVKGIVLPFHQYVFERGGSPVHVFYCRWEDKLDTAADSVRADGGKLSRVRAVLAGQRHLGQQVLEAVISGPETAAEALDTFAKQLPDLIRR